MKFHILNRNGTAPSGDTNAVYLTIDHWNDYSFVTMFQVQVFDENGASHHLPNVKIGFRGQTQDISTYERLDKEFTSLGDEFFSLGTDVEYYRGLTEELSENWRDEYLRRIRDVSFDPSILEAASEEKVFQTSHLRGVSINAVRDQFVRVLKGEAPSTDFNFSFVLPKVDTFAGFELKFNVKAGSKPRTNIHAIIGRNGVGKTTLLNSMVKSVASSPNTEASFFDLRPIFEPRKISKEYFGGLVSIAFSAFDPFDMPPENSDPAQGTLYSYVGLTEIADEGGALLKSRDALFAEFVESLKFCLSEKLRRERWARAVETLESDENFASMRLLQLLEVQVEAELEETALRLIKKMSSGHAIVILILTKLVAKLVEKTLVLLDEPESHLHPPLLSALIRSLSELLHNRNAVAIIATHSPVVLQEIPKSCVWKIIRSRTASSWARPTTETFGENVGTLTREVFGLEVVKSGFHTILSQSVSEGRTYDEVFEEFGGNLGFEARGILRAMVAERDEDILRQ